MGLCAVQRFHGTQNEETPDRLRGLGNRETGAPAEIPSRVKRQRFSSFSMPGVVEAAGDGSIDHELTRAISSPGASRLPGRECDV